MKPTDAQLAELARILAVTDHQEIDCAEVLSRLASYVNALTEESAWTEHLRQVAQHMKVCPECREELAALIQAEGAAPRTILPEDAPPE